VWLAAAAKLSLSPHDQVTMCLQGSLQNCQRVKRIAMTHDLSAPIKVA